MHRTGLTRVIAGVAAAGLAVSCVLLARSAGKSPHAPSAAVPLAARRQRPVSGAFAACEQRLEHRRGGLRVVIVGASITAGVGAGSPDKSWAVLLARMLHADAVVYGVSGAGYIRPGAGRLGPMSAEIARLDLRDVRPGLVVVQAGHDDIGEPPGLERRDVSRTIALIHSLAPRALIGVVTVFPGRSPRLAAARTDFAIVSAARAADHHVIVMDPLTGGWRYARAADGLHPTAAGDAQIARDVRDSLAAHGVTTPSGQRSPIVCASGPAGASLRER